jgi:hypothetical protein
MALYATRPAYTREAVYQQTQRWLRAGVFEAMVHDLRVLLLRLSKGTASEPTAAILDSRTLRSTPESGSRGGYDGAKSKKGSKVHAAVDTLGHLLAWSAISHGHRDFGAWSKTMSGYPRPWRGCTSLRSLVSSFNKQPPSSARVHNSL